MEKTTKEAIVYIKGKEEIFEIKEEGIILEIRSRNIETSIIKEFERINWSDLCKQINENNSGIELPIEHDFKNKNILFEKQNGYCFLYIDNIKYNYVFDYLTFGSIFELLKHCIENNII